MNSTVCSKDNFKCKARFRATLLIFNNRSQLEVPQWHFLFRNTFKDDHELLSQQVTLRWSWPTKPLRWWKCCLLYRGCEITAQVSDISWRESSYREMYGSVWKPGSKYLSHMRLTFIDRLASELEFPKQKHWFQLFFAHTLRGNGIYELHTVFFTNQEHAKETWRMRKAFVSTDN